MSYLLDSYRAHRARQQRMWRNPIKVEDHGIMSRKEWQTLQAAKREAARLERIVATFQPLKDLEPALTEEPREISAKEAREIIENTDRIFIEQIIKAACAYFNVTKKYLLSTHRNKTIVRYRHIVMYLAKQHTTLSYPQTGYYIGGRDHTTIMHGVAKITELLCDDEAGKLKADIEGVEKVLAQLMASNSVSEDGNAIDG